MTADDLCVRDKATKECNSGVVHLGAKLLQPPLSLPSNTMMVQQVNHHRSHPSYGLAVGHGPTGDRIRSGSNNMYDVVGDGACGVNFSGCGGAVGVRTLQPFLDISPTAFNSPGSMAASFGFPFTNAQWKELERQAVIYKYLMTSVPVPTYLLSPAPENLASGRIAATYSPNLLGRALNLRFTNGADLEPGRCRRTDGKKWRCSRDVAPDQKYCERHMNRGRPRSRKPVEVHANNKKARHNVANSAESPVNQTVNCSATASQFVGALSRPCLPAPIFLDKWSGGVGKFNASDSFISSYREPRNLDRIIKGQTAPIASTDDKQWHCMVETKSGLATDSSFNGAPILNQHHLEPPTTPCTLFLERTPRGFIDAWSTGVSKDHNRNHPRNSNTLSSNGKPCPSSLTLSMGGNDTIDDDNKMGQVQMSLGLVDSDQNHESVASTTTTIGGPLAEALQLTPLSTTISQSSSDSPRRITVSSPCGFLQKTLAPISDSSDNSCPTSNNQT